MKNKLKNILIPIDLSDTALNALNTATQMAKRHQAILHLLYTQDIMEYYPKMGQMAILEPMQEEVMEKDIFLLEKVVLSIRHTHGVNCVLHVATGCRSTIITERSAELNIDLVIVGTDPDISEQSCFNDSLPYKILQNTASHVLTVPAGNEINNFSHIIFPVMCREHSINKLALSQDVIRQNKAAVSVIEMLKNQDLDLLASIRNVSEQIKRRLNMLAGAVTKSTIYTLNMAKDLTRLAKDTHAQLVIVSGDTRRNLKEFFFGSFTQRMIRNGEVAVLFTNEHPVKEPVKRQLEVAYSRALQLNC